MAIMTSDLFPERKDTVTNHDIPTSGNARFPSMAVEAVKPSVHLSAAEVDKTATEVFRKVEIIKLTGSLSVTRESAWVQADSTIESPEFTILEAERLLEPWKQIVITPIFVDISELIDQETNKLDVLSDGIGPALLMVLHKHGSMSITTFLGNLDIQREDLISHLSVLERNRLVTLGNEQYSITSEGIAFLGELGLVE